MVRGDYTIADMVQGSYGPSTEEKPYYEKKCKLRLPLHDKSVLICLQSSPRQRPPVSPPEAPTRPFPNSLTMMTMSTCSLNGLLRSRRTGRGELLTRW
jgi:hypothetical protein